MAHRDKRSRGTTPLDGDGDDDVHVHSDDDRDRDMHSDGDVHVHGDGDGDGDGDVYRDDGDDDDDRDVEQGAAMPDVRIPDTVSVPSHLAYTPPEVVRGWFRKKKSKYQLQPLQKLGVREREFLRWMAEFWTPALLARVMRVVTGHSPATLSLLDWLVTNFAKKYDVKYRLSAEDAWLFDMWHSYERSLADYGRSCFDPFCRGQRILIEYVDPAPAPVPLSSEAVSAGAGAGAGAGDSAASDDDCDDSRSSTDSGRRRCRRRRSSSSSSSSSLTADDSSYTDDTAGSTAIAAAAAAGAAACAYASPRRAPRTTRDVNLVATRRVAGVKLRYLITTVAQLLFFRWAINHAVLDFCERHASAICADMERFRPNPNPGSGHRRKLSLPATRVPTVVAGPVRLMYGLGETPRTAAWPYLPLVQCARIGPAPPRRPVP